ncbi:MAG: hypothetical protein ACI37U_11380 [Bacteroides sp.]
MKTNIISIAAIALAGILGGCNDRYEELDQPHTPQPAGTEVRVGVSVEGQTRLGITDTGNQLVYTWQDYDSFRVYSMDNREGTIFTIDPEAERTDPSIASFVGTPANAYQEGETLYAVFDGSDSYEMDAEGNLTLRIEGQSGWLDDRFQYLYGEAVYHEGQPINFTMKHLMTMLKLRIQVPEGVDRLQEVHVGSYSSLSTSATLVLFQSPSDYAGTFQSGDVVNCYDNQNHASELTIGGDFEADANGIATVYLYLLPVKGYGSGWSTSSAFTFTSSFYVTDSAGAAYVSTASVAQREIEAGKTYQVSSPLYRLADFDNETEAGAGTEANPYRISTAEQLYSLMYRANFGLMDFDESTQSGRSYSGCCYQLVNDITLNDEMPWKAFPYGDGVFDGAGYALKGNISFASGDHQGIFSSIDYGTVRNLILDFDRVTYSENVYQSGLLACNTNFSTITGCGNRTDLRCNAYGYFAGLIGYCWYSTIETCYNTGNLSCGSIASVMGGIVAYASRGTSIVGCYNTGSFTIDRLSGWNTLHLGGLTGQLEDEAQLSYCWSSSTATLEDVVYNENYTGSGSPLYVGGLVGYAEGTVSNSYWQEAMGTATGFGEATNCFSFAGATPDADQIAALNSGIASTGWKFTDQGTFEPVTDTTLPSLPKEEW